MLSLAVPGCRVQRHFSAQDLIWGIRFETKKVQKRFWTINQQPPNWQQIDSTRNRTTTLQRIGVRLHRYATRLILQRSTNGFCSSALREKNKHQKAVPKNSNGFKPPTLHTRNCAPFFGLVCAPIEPSSGTATPLAGCKRVSIYSKYNLVFSNEYIITSEFNLIKILRKNPKPLHSQNGEEMQVFDFFENAHRHDSAYVDYGHSKWRQKIDEGSL